MNIIVLSEAFEHVATSPSKLKKELLLLEYSKLEGFTNVLQFAFNPFIVTGLAKKKIEKVLTPNTYYINSSLLELMNYVKENNSGSDMVVSIVQTWIRNQPSEIHEFLKSIFIKDLKVGITSSTINKVFGKNWIPKYDVMLASKWADHCEKLKGDFQVSLKLDGIRCTVFNEESGPKFFTRQGHPIEGLIELEEIFKKMSTGYVYDGELIAVNVDKSSSDVLFRYTQKLVRKDGIKKNVEFFAFDKLTIEEFHAGKSTLKLNDRFISLQNDVENIDNILIKLVPVYYLGNDQEEVYKILERVTADGYEGLMVSPLNSYYETKRSRTLLKVKKFQTADLIILGTEEHKHGNKLGSLVVDYKGYSVNVGSGFNDFERDLMWDQREELIGKIVEVGYFEESSNQKGGISLRFPTFKHLRPDKTEPSYN